MPIRKNAPAKRRSPLPMAKKPAIESCHMLFHGMFQSSSCAPVMNRATAKVGAANRARRSTSVIVSIRAVCDPRKVLEIAQVIAEPSPAATPIACPTLGVARGGALAPIPYMQDMPVPLVQRTRWPSWKTATTRLTAVMSWVGSPSTARRSASLPTSMVPIS